MDQQGDGRPVSGSKEGSKSSAISGRRDSKSSRGSRRLSSSVQGKKLSVIPDEQEGENEEGEGEEGEVRGDDEVVRESEDVDGKGDEAGEGTKEEVTGGVTAPTEGELSKADKPFSSRLSFDMRLSIGSSETSRLSKLGSDKKGKKDSGAKARALGSIISIRRGSYGDGAGGGPKVAKYMNSYKIDSDKPFHVESVQKILQDVLNEALEELTYDPEGCVAKAKWATSALRAKLKEQEYDRYKLLCLVTIGEKRSQDVYTSMKFLWDSERDKYATFAAENMFVYGYASCFGFYYE